MTYQSLQEFFGCDANTLQLRILLIAFMWILVLFAIAIDFISGVRKAKERGELRTSEGYRMTVRKILQYYSLLAFAVLFDALIMLVFTIFGFDDLKIFPLTSFIGSFFLIFIEWRSFMEKAHIKTKRQFKDGLTEIITVLEKRDDLVELLKRLIKEQEDEANK